MSHRDDSRLTTELELLQAMYPEQVDYSPKGRDLKFADESAVLQLRIPEGYPDAGLPDIISANDVAKKDIRDHTKAAVRALGLGEGEEVLDAIIACFQRILETNHVNDSPAGPDSVAEAPPEASKTVIIWLHHLLALTKRKLALSSALAGVTKPGYPGIMVFSGAASAVRDHVDTLKGENWQAFQVRYESDCVWEFEHGSGVKEVETMAEVVKAVQVGTHGSMQKEAFLTAVGIK